MKKVTLDMQDGYSDAEGKDPFVLICRDESGTETRAAQIGQKGVLVTRGLGLCFVPDARIQATGDQNRIA